MISFYTGTPGSGKSYHLAHRCKMLLCHQSCNIIANFDINLENCALTLIGWWKRRINEITKGLISFRKYNTRKLKGHFEYWMNPDITPENLLDFARQHHERRKEGQTLVIIDEAGIIFNCRQFASKDRQNWLEFFAKHRHFGFDFILATQFDRQVDKQIRCCVEYETVHRKLRNYKFFGWLLSVLAGGNIFVAKQYWYASRDKLVIEADFMRYSSRIAALYDTYAEFSRDGADTFAGGGLGGPAENGPEPYAEPTPENVDLDAQPDTVLEDVADVSKLWLSRIIDFLVWPFSEVAFYLGDWFDRFRGRTYSGPVDVQLSDLFGGDVDVTKPLSDRKKDIVSCAVVPDDDLDRGAADHDTDGRSGGD